LTFGKKMTHHSLHLLLPDEPPFTDDYFLESFVGRHVRPLANKLRLFWFSRYGAPRKGEVKFRFSVDDYESIRSEIEALTALFKPGEDGCGPYNYVVDLAGDRFIASERKSTHQAQRGMLAYEFLTASAKLFIDCLVENGVGWKHEEETATGYNRKTPLEQYHHLFCNMTGVPTWAAVLRKGEIQEVVSDFQSRSIKDPSIEIILWPIRH